MKQVTHHTLITIDPGLDGTGWALFRRDPSAPDTLAVGPGKHVLRAGGTIRTRPSELLPSRLRKLALGVRDLREQGDAGLACLWVVEMPQAVVTYHRNRGKGRSANAVMASTMFRMHQALGAILTGILWPGEDTTARDGLLLYEAPRTAKEMKQQQARYLLDRSGLSHGSADMRDAVWLGAYVLTRVGAPTGHQVFPL